MDNGMGILLLQYVSRCKKRSQTPRDNTEMCLTVRQRLYLRQGRQLAPRVQCCSTPMSIHLWPFGWRSGEHIRKGQATWGDFRVGKRV